MSSYEYRIELRAPQWGDGSWDADEIKLSPSTEDEAKALIETMRAEDVEDGETFDYRVVRRPAAWEEIYFVPRQPRLAAES